jgi:hypothetical protein
MQQNDLVSDYSLDEILVHVSIGKSCLSYLVYIGDQNPSISKRLYLRFPLLHYAAYSWQYHLLKLEGRPWDLSLEQLAFNFLTYGSRAWQIWSTVGFYEGAHNYNVSAPSMLPFIRPRIADPANTTQIHPMTWIAFMGLNSILRKFISRRPDWNSIPETPFLGSPLYAAVCKLTSN